MITEMRIGERGCQQLTEIEHFVTPITTIGNGTNARTNACAFSLQQMIWQEQVLPTLLARSSMLAARRSARSTEVPLSIDQRPVRPRPQRLAAARGCKPIASAVVTPDRAARFPRQCGEGGSIKQVYVPE
jgi:hypothetical protein